MTYRHEPTGILGFQVFDGNDKMIRIENCHNLFPLWIVKGNDWKLIFENNARIFDPLEEKVYIKNDKTWKCGNTSYAYSIFERMVKEDWYLLKEDERVWLTLDGREIPFSKVSQQHWSNIYHYHKRINALAQVEIATEELNKRNWELLPQNRM